MQEDRFFVAVQKIVRRVLDDTSTIDFRLLYPARVVQWSASGINPSGLVDVVFISDDIGQVATKLRSKAGIPLLPATPGQDYVPQAGTQVLVGWQGGDERYPYAIGWLGLGGVDTVTQRASNSVVMSATGPGSHADVTAGVGGTVNLGDAVGGQPVVVQAMVTATSTLLGLMTAYFTNAQTAWTAVSPLLATPADQAAATAAGVAAGAIATGLGVWQAALSTYTTLKTKAT